MNTRKRKNLITNSFFKDDERNKPEPTYIIIPNPAFNIDVEPANPATTVPTPEVKPETFKFTRP